MPPSSAAGAWPGSASPASRQRQGELAWYAAGVAFGLGLLSKYTMFMLVPCVALWLASSPRLRPWFRRQEPYVAAALGLLIFSPVIVWNARHGWYSLRHVLIQAGGGGERSVLATLCWAVPSSSAARWAWCRRSCSACWSSA